MNINKVEYNVAIHTELIKYKDYFHNAVNIYFNNVFSDKSIENYTSENTKKNTRLKITYQSSHYKELIDLIEIEINERNQNKGEEKKVSQTVLINNIMSVLLKNEYYN